MISQPARGGTKGGQGGGALWYQPFMVSVLFKAAVEGFGTNLVPGGCNKG